MADSDILEYSNAEDEKSHIHLGLRKMVALALPLRRVGDYGRIEST